MVVDFGALEARLQVYSAAVDDAARTLLQSDAKHAGLYDMLRYHLGQAMPGEQGISHSAPQGAPQPGTGKHLRPALCLLVAQSLGGDWRPALPAATGVELVHQFSLIHDDIEDSSPLRRHRETVWAKWGLPQALNAGDALLIVAHQAITTVEPKLEPATAVAALHILDQGCRELCEGQYLDLAWEQEPSVSVADYLGMVERKTARLFECAARLGALCAGASTDAQTQIAAFARALGMAFQVADDMAGVWGSEAATGKPAAEDVVSRKKALPATLALARPEAEAKRLAEIYGVDRNLTEAETTEAIGLLDAMGIRDEAQQLLTKLHDEAVEHLAEAGPPEQLAELLYFTELALPD